MEINSMNLGIDRENNKSVQQFESFLLSKGAPLLPKRCRTKLGSERTLIIDIRRSRVRLSFREWYLLNIHGLHNNIPKHIMTLEEKYALRCLELIWKCALRAADRNFTTIVGILPDLSNLAEFDSLSSKSSITRLAIECPSVADGEVITNSTGPGTIGTISCSQSMVNILKSPLLQKFGSFDGTVKFQQMDLLDARARLCSVFSDSPQESAKTLCVDRDKEVSNLDHTNVSLLMHKNDASISSTNSSSSHESSSPAHRTSYHGMLQCTWKGRLPNHIFTVDDKKEVYMASLSTTESSGCQALDFVYTFHSRKNTKKECEVELENVAKMQVSTSITVSSSKAEVRETQFVLSVSSDSHTREMQTSVDALKKNKRLTRKVVNAFRLSHSTNRRSLSRLQGSSAISENTSWDPYEDVHYDCPNSSEGFVEDKDPPNFEVAAIIVKDIYKNRKEGKVGGWGLKFLNRTGNDASLETSTASECSRNSDECMTSVNIIIPAGVHGGPRTRVGGPSSLTERWISGGRCDCGGWDIGCPLRILKTRWNMEDYSFSNFGEIKSVDIYMQGSNQNVPIMKMVNIHEGLYYIHFQSTLSALQSFAIAAAIIHSQSSVLRPKVYRSRVTC